jgi:hypothetical protein
MTILVTIEHMLDLKTHFKTFPSVTSHTAYS